jgi:E3 ubiquitin-protein ligase RNF10
VVLPTGDYRAQTLDPDVPIPWDSILQILVSPANMVACPICLAETPVAPRMTKCGHTACLPCFIRYFASEDVVTGLRGSNIKFRKCPICWDSIAIGEVKPVRWYIIDDGMDDENIVVAREPQEGFDVAMRLFMRKRGTTLVLPRDDFVQVEQTEMLPEGDVPWHYVPEILHYAWIVKGSEMYMKDESEREIVDLQTMEKEDEAFGDDPVWTHRAIQRIHNASETYTGLGSGPSTPLLLSTATTSRETPYFFYQPRSASHYYLSSLDVRILKRAYGEYANFPSAILARVEHITSPQPIDDEFRRRIKYLNHLPTGTQVSFLECDWSETVDPNVLEDFTSEIDKRRRFRKEKLVREEKEREMEERCKRSLRRNLFVEEEFLSREDSEDVTWVIANAAAGIQVEKSDSPIIESGTPRPAGTTVWGTPRVTPSRTPVIPSTPKEPEVEAEPGEAGGVWTQNWEEMLKDPTKPHPSRRKKGKKLVLMSNSVHRGT